MRRLRIFWTRLSQVEYWPFWVFYGPFIPILAWYGMRNKSLLHFLVANPGIRNSGCFNSSKYDVLKQINPEFLPKTHIIKEESKATFVNDQATTINYPIIIKPDKGNRGRGVVLAKNQDQLEQALQHRGDFIIQEYIDSFFEYGIFYYHDRDREEYGITGITGKKYLTVHGNGKLTLGTLLSGHVRAKHNLSYFKEKFSDQWEQVIHQNEELLIEEIGNHNRGTQFIDASHLITSTLTEKMHHISQQIQGFYWGRFDIKTYSEKDLQNGENLKILEVNGGSSEPGHMFDPKYNWWDVRRFILQHLKLHHNVVRANMRRGAEAPSFRSFTVELKQYFSNKRDQLS